MVIILSHDIILQTSLYYYLLLATEGPFSSCRENVMCCALEIESFLLKQSHHTVHEAAVQELPIGTSKLVIAFI